MTVAGLAKSSFVDYPGLISCVLFVPGCNYDCFYCHNRTLLQKTSGTVAPEDVDAFLKKRRGQLDGVVVSGGEPTLQPDLISYLGMLKGLGYKVKLDTNGSSPEVIDEALRAGVCDYFAVDYKAPATRYREICGGNADAGPVLGTIGLLSENHVAFEVRTTVIPQLKKGDLLTMAGELPRLPRYVLNRYRAPEVFSPGDRARIEEAPYTEAEIRAFAEEIRVFQPNVVT